VGDVFLAHFGGVMVWGMFSWHTLDFYSVAPEWRIGEFEFLDEDWKSAEVDSHLSPASAPPTPQSRLY